MDARSEVWAAPPIRLLTYTTLYPNPARPNHGVFVENRLRHLLASGNATSTVVAPVPWFPSTARLFGDWGRHASVPRCEVRNGIEVYHPRYPVIPRIGMSIAPWLMYRAILPWLRRRLGNGGYDVIDAHYVYPDGVAAVWLGQTLGLPVVITARGTDVTLIPTHFVPRMLIRKVIAGAAALITVSAALKDGLVALGAPRDKVTVLRNGVDTSLFRPLPGRSASRRTLGLTRPTLISVGHLIERKGHHLIVEAMPQLPGFDLLIVGEGSERARLAALIERLTLSDRVRLMGARPHAELPALYGAADALVLASSREGWANVLLEAMACGTPAVASNIPGNPEVVQSREAGLIVQENTPRGIAEAVLRLFAAPPQREETRAYAERFSWDETTAGQIAVFRGVLARSHSQQPLLQGA